jgi:hypothetical protein
LWNVSSSSSIPPTSFKKRGKQKIRKLVEKFVKTKFFRSCSPRIRFNIWPEINFFPPILLLCVLYTDENSRVFCHRIYCITSSFLLYNFLFYSVKFFSSPLIFDLRNLTGNAIGQSKRADKCGAHHEFPCGRFARGR